MEFTCQDALPLVPSYLDGELTEVRAGMLRKHLLDCSSCRTSVGSPGTELEFAL